MATRKRDRRSERDRAYLAKQGYDVDAMVKRVLNGEHAAVYEEIVENVARKSRTTTRKRN